MTCKKYYYIALDYIKGKLKYLNLILYSNAVINFAKYTVIYGIL